MSRYGVFSGLYLDTFHAVNFIPFDFSFIKTEEAVVQRCSVKKVPLEILQNTQENTCALQLY